MQTGQVTEPRKEGEGSCSSVSARGDQLSCLLYPHPGLTAGTVRANSSSCLGKYQCWQGRHERD